MLMPLSPHFQMPVMTQCHWPWLQIQCPPTCPPSGQPQGYVRMAVMDGKTLWHCVGVSYMCLHGCLNLCFNKFVLWKGAKAHFVTIRKVTSSRSTSILAISPSVALIIARTPLWTWCFHVFSAWSHCILSCLESSIWAGPLPWGAPCYQEMGALAGPQPPSS